LYRVSTEISDVYIPAGFVTRCLVINSGSVLDKKTQQSLHVLTIGGRLERSPRK
jgi:hypothetical protein